MLESVDSGNSLGLKKRGVLCGTWRILRNLRSASPILEKIALTWQQHWFKEISHLFNHSRYVSYSATQVLRFGEILSEGPCRSIGSLCVSTRDVEAFLKMTAMHTT